MPIETADASRLAIILVDVQDYFLEKMHGESEPLICRLEQLLIVSEWFDVPVLATLEEPVERKGELPARLSRLFPESGRIRNKFTYNLCAEEQIADVLTDLNCQQFAVAGGETDVCVLQSVLGLLDRQKTVFLLEDCLYSSEVRVGPALRRMYSAGAIPCTYKSLYYELLRTEDPRRWEAELAAAQAKGFVPVETLPPSISHGDSFFDG